MIRYLKSGQTAEATAEKQAEVRKTVEAILENIARNGDRAVREYSDKFDHWSPASFPLERGADRGLRCGGARTGQA
jgi:sulfopropanediol 3-dehydrogenase